MALHNESGFSLAKCARGEKIVIVINIENIKFVNDEGKKWIFITTNTHWTAINFFNCCYRQIYGLVVIDKMQSPYIEPNRKASYLLIVVIVLFLMFLGIVIGRIMGLW